MSVKGMIFLDTENQILMETLTTRLGPGSTRPVEPIDLRLCDFDDVQYNLVIKENLMDLSIAYRPYRQLEGFGAKQMLQEKYKEFKVISPKSSFDLTLQIDTNQIPPEASVPVIQKMATLKRNLLGAPLEQCFEAMKKGTSSSLSPVEIPYRPNESIFIQPQADRIVLIFSVCFEDKTDQAVARVFLQEFADVGRRVNNAPPTSFSRDPPLELRNMKGLKSSKDLVGYLSIAVFKSHVETQAKLDKTVTMLQGFRNYLDYHIKASKSYLHSRMRQRVHSLLHVLNRAHPEKDPSKTSKKTISGKTFSRT